MQQCQELIDKVREFRYLKVRGRQVNKFNRLLQKEGNITCSSTPNPWPGIAYAQAVLTHSQDRVQATLNSSQARVSIPVMVPKLLQWEMPILPQIIHQVSLGNKGLDLEAQGRHPGFKTSWDPNSLNLGHLGVHPHWGGKQLRWFHS